MKEDEATQWEKEEEQQEEEQVEGEEVVMLVVVDVFLLPLSAVLPPLSSLPSFSSPTTVRVGTFAVLCLLLLVVSPVAAMIIPHEKAVCPGSIFVLPKREES